eukprot:11824359-Heterocapsa_arctica.AAC.1
MMTISRTCSGSSPSRRSHGPWCARMVSCAPTVDVDLVRACARIPCRRRAQGSPSHLGRSNIVEWITSA